MKWLFFNERDKQFVRDVNNGELIYYLQIDCLTKIIFFPSLESSKAQVRTLIWICLHNRISAKWAVTKFVSITCKYRTASNANILQNQSSLHSYSCTFTFHAMADLISYPKTSSRSGMKCYSTKISNFTVISATWQNSLDMCTISRPTRARINCKNDSF